MKHKLSEVSDKLDIDQTTGELKLKEPQKAEQNPDPIEVKVIAFDMNGKNSEPLPVKVSIKKCNIF